MSMHLYLPQPYSFWAPSCQLFTLSRTRPFCKIGEDMEANLSDEDMEEIKRGVEGGRLVMIEDGDGRFEGETEGLYALSLSLPEMQRCYLRPWASNRNTAALKETLAYEKAGKNRSFFVARIERAIKASQVPRTAKDVMAAMLEAGDQGVSALSIGGRVMADVVFE